LACRWSYWVTTCCHTLLVLCIMLTNSLIIEMNVQDDDYRWFEMPAKCTYTESAITELHPAHAGTFCNIQQVICKNVVTTLMTGGLHNDTWMRGLNWWLYSPYVTLWRINVKQEWLKIQKTLFIENNPNCRKIIQCPPWGQTTYYRIFTFH
jgi:hypothetical protein